MKQVQFHQYGEPEVLHLEEVPIPQPGPGEVLIRVEAAGINFADTMQRRNTYPQPTPLPGLPGGEITGVVEQVGTGVSSVAVGNQVVAVLPNGGGYADYAVAPASMAFPLPPGVSGQQALALQLQGLTAYLLLKKAAHLQPGETVLIHSAAGGIGTLLVQVAKLLGAGAVIATASTDEKLDLARSLGADAAINYTHIDWPQQVKQANNGAGIAIILDAVGGDIFQQSFDCLAPFGRLINYGNSSGKPSSVDVWQLTVPNQSVSGFYLGGYFGQPTLIQEAYGFLFSHTASGQLKIHIGQTLPLHEAAQAHHLLESRQTTGKVVLIP